MLTAMEEDLKTKVTEALSAQPEAMSYIPVHGIFSVDDLESKMESDLGDGMGIGVQYHSSEIDSGQANSRARTLQFNYLIILAIPVPEDTAKRHNGTTVLSILRNSILGTAVAGDRTNRTWDFIREKPEVGASTKTMLYYSQLWQVAIQNVA